jgi:hypothetical protein
MTKSHPGFRYNHFQILKSRNCCNVYNGLQKKSKFRSTPLVNNSVYLKAKSGVMVFPWTNYITANLISENKVGTAFGTNNRLGGVIFLKYCLSK